MYSPPILEFGSVSGVSTTPVEHESEDMPDISFTNDITTTHITYSVPYETPPYDELVDYAVRKHLPLKPLRAHAEAMLEQSRRFMEVAKLNPGAYATFVQWGTAPEDPQAESEYWSQKIGELGCYAWD
jgi:hypothetical protein